MKCIQCANDAYKFRGEVYALCATCGWYLLVKLHGYVDDRPVTDKEKVDRVLDYVPYDEWAEGNNWHDNE